MPAALEQRQAGAGDVLLHEMAIRNGHGAILGAEDRQRRGADTRQVGGQVEAVDGLPGGISREAQVGTGGHAAVDLPLGEGDGIHIVEPGAEVEVGVPAVTQQTLQGASQGGKAIQQSNAWIDQALDVRQQAPTDYTRHADQAGDAPRRQQRRRAQGDLPTHRVPQQRKALEAQGVRQRQHAPPLGQEAVVTMLRLVAVAKAQQIEGDTVVMRLQQRQRGAPYAAVRQPAVHQDQRRVVWAARQAVR